MSRPRTSSPFVYFVRQADGLGPVKIGCSQAPEKRLADLMAWSPHPLALVATLPGDEVLERRFHARFRDQHSHHEWFHPSVALDGVIAAVAAGAFDVDELPPPRALPARERRRCWTEEMKRRASNGREFAKLRKLGATPPAEAA